MTFLTALYVNCGPAYALLFAMLCVASVLPRRSRFPARATAGAGLFVLLSLTLLLFDQTAQDYLYVRTLYYYAMYAVIVLLIWSCFLATFIETLYVTTVGAILQHFMFSFSEIILLASQLWGRPINSSSAIYAAGNTVFYIVSYAAVAFLFNRYLKNSILSINKIRLIVPIILLPTSTTLMNMLIELTPHDPQQMLYYRFYSIMVCASVFCIMLGVFETGKIQREMELIKQVNARQTEQYEMKKELIDLINIRCHDLKKQVNLMTDMRRYYDEEELRRIEHDLFLYDFMAHTGNEILDVILTDKGLRCEREKIKLTYLIDGAQLDFIQPTDMYAIFGNLFDNAIESVIRLKDPEKRVISMKMTTVGDMIYLHMFNYCQDEGLTFVDGLPQTTKEDRTNHGFGMKSIRMSVEKYGGELQVCTENSIFNVNIMLCRMGGAPDGSF